MYLFVADILHFGEPACGWKTFLEDCDQAFDEELEACRCPVCGSARYSKTSDCYLCISLKRPSSDTMSAAEQSMAVDEERKRKRAEGREKEMADRNKILESTQDKGLRALME